MRALVLLTLLTFAIWQGYGYLTSHSHLLDPKEQHYLLLYAAIALFCAWVVGGAVRSAGRVQVQREQYHRRADLYEGFTGLWYEVLETAAQEPREVNVRLEIGAFKARIALHASREVIQAFNQLSTLLAKEAPTTAPARAAFESLLLAMRTDLSQSNLYPLRNEIKKLFASNHI